MSATAAAPFVVFGYGSLIFKVDDLLRSTVRLSDCLAPSASLLRMSFPRLQVPGFLKGYVRRFAQKSHDHRGTPENPGRVVTLVHKEDWDLFSNSDPFPDEDTVWGTGVAYTIDPEYEADVRAYLDYREKDGYTMETMPIYGVVDGLEAVIIPNVCRSPSICAFPFSHSCLSLPGLCDATLAVKITRLSVRLSFTHTYARIHSNSHPMYLKVGSEPLPALAHRIWISVGPSGPNKEYLYNLANAVRKLSPESYDKHLFALEELVKALDHGSAPN
ncbi:Gamma-glutamylcyclotransferase [Mycena sanguinolenta]|uniref:glutathione-specific gamma-glutamylcyclotransferase n=1 Tax=Mycena sanguinolenta TaxID=230812 RepID=A0A8H7CLK3_9AGAR|nr:Gamma-glutamylcyclotransferase [Mycena sanguinolenta]